MLKIFIEDTSDIEVLIYLFCIGYFWNMLEC